MQKLSFDCSGENTSDIEHCGNLGCTANKDGNCVMSGGECFGYIDPPENNNDEKSIVFSTLT